MSYRPGRPVRWVAFALSLGVCAATGQAFEIAAATELFEREVRPVLIETCQTCHGADTQEADLRLDSRDALLRGGKSGPAVVPGEPEKSLLLAALRQAGKLKMPPDDRLSDRQVAAFEQWIKLGAAWPKTASTNSRKADVARTHWAFQPVREPALPAIQNPKARIHNPIDRFIMARLAASGLTPSPPADRRTLIRRATFDLTGLPPTSDEVHAFENDSDPLAYERLIDRLLASPHYGEQWGRHWLDVARYSDTKGYVYAREQRQWIHAWVYRDWVVKALNDDMPYDRFLLLQIAADEAAPDEPEHLAAMGFLTLGRRFLGVQREIIDDRIDVLTRGTMGLTVACARCHDHKYDPIPTRDYYSVYGVFQSCLERVVPVARPEVKDKAYEQYAAELEKREAKLAETMAARRQEVAGRNRARVGDYLKAQLELEKYPYEGFDQILEKTDLLPTFVHRWQRYLRAAAKRDDPIFTAWHAYTAIPKDEFFSRAAAVTQELARRPAGEVHPLVAERLKTPPASMAEVAASYGKLFVEIDSQWQELTKTAAEKNEPPPSRLPDDWRETLRQVLYSSSGPCEVPDEPIVNIEYFFDSASCNELWKLQNEVDNWILQGPPIARHAIVLNDREVPATPRVFRRGNPANKGDDVPRQFVEVLAGPDRQPFAHGSGRLELAQAIIDPANPLTARVIVNRVWMHHFGEGLVRTPSDFGTRAGPPSHPELLDWLASRFIEDGWSLKRLHRRIMTSQTYRQASVPAMTNDQVPRTKQVPNPNSETLDSTDPENRLLARMNPRRLTFEELRDSLLVATGKLDRTVGGRPGDMFSPDFKRRTLYGTIDRQFLPTALRVFDFANPDLHVPQRSDTTVPQQALFFLNDPLMVQHARALAEATAGAANAEERVQAMFQLAYQRTATNEQLQAAMGLVELAKHDSQSVPSPTAPAWRYGYGAYDEKAERVANFEPLPHFTGSAWQGGPAWPDNKLGWVQLTATGGHPGNDLAHAAIRRWTAPRDVRVRIESTLVHEPKEGEGVRGFIISSRSRLIAQAKVHNGKADLGAESLVVEAGDTIDFVADIGNKLSHNQFLWKATITPLDSADETPPLAYESERDFEAQGIQPLNAWEQLAQVLLSANEFVFVD